VREEVGALYFAAVACIVFVGVTAYIIGYTDMDSVVAAIFAIGVGIAVYGMFTHAVGLIRNQRRILERRNEKLRDQLDNSTTLVEFKLCGGEIEMTPVENDKNATVDG